MTDEDAAVAKGMLLRGDRQHDIAAWFGVNGGRIAEIASGAAFRHLDAAPAKLLPPVGPYPGVQQVAGIASVLHKAKRTISSALKGIEEALESIEGRPKK